MRRSTKSMILLLLICAVAFIVRSINSEEKDEKKEKDVKIEPTYVSATDIFNEMAKPTPWIYGFIDRNQIKYPPEKEWAYMITDRLKEPDEESPDKIKKIEDRYRQMKKDRKGDKRILENEADIDDRESIDSHPSYSTQL